MLEVATYESERRIRGALVLALLLGVGVVLPLLVNERSDVTGFRSGDDTTAERE